MGELIISLPFQHVDTDICTYFIRFVSSHLFAYMAAFSQDYDMPYQNPRRLASITGPFTFFLSIHGVTWRLLTWCSDSFLEVDNGRIGEKKDLITVVSFLSFIFLKVSIYIVYTYMPVMKCQYNNTSINTQII